MKRQKGLQKQLPKLDRQPSVEQALRFLDDYQKLVGGVDDSGSTLISLRVSKGLLRSFRFLAERNKIPYQTLIKKLMQAYLKNPNIVEK